MPEETKPTVEGGDPKPPPLHGEATASWRSEQMETLRKIEQKLDPADAPESLAPPEALTAPEPLEQAPEQDDDAVEDGALDEAESGSEEKQKQSGKTKRRRRRRRRSSTADDDIDLESALEHVRRDKVPSTVIERMTDEEILAAGAEARRRAQEIHSLRRERDELAKAEPAATPDDSTPVSDGAQVEEPTVDVAELVAPFSDEYGAEAAEALTTVSKKIAGAYVQPLQRENQELRKALKSQAADLIGYIEEGVRDDFGKRFSDLKDDEFYAEDFVPQLKKLAKTGEYNLRTRAGVTSLYEDSSRLLGLKPEDETEGEPSPTVEAQAEDNGQATPAPKQHEQPLANTPDEANWKLFKGLNSGKSRHEAQRAAGLPLH